MKRLLASFGVAAALFTTPAQAATIGFEFNAGQLTFIETILFDPEVEIIEGFILGEDILVSFTIDDQTADIDPLPGRAEYEDPFGTISIRGADSGTVLDLINGVNIQLDGPDEFDLRNIETDLGFGEFALTNDIDFGTNVPILSDPEDLAGSIAELAALLDENGVFQISNTAIFSSAEIDAVDSEGEFSALEFGPVTSVPVPPALALMGLVVAGFGLMRRKPA